jgi:CheY-like chemotaxis protein
MQTHALVRVLLVDDDPAVRRVVRRMLETRGHDVVDVESAEQALALLHQVEVPPHLIVSDVELPGESGPAFVGMARRIWPGIKAILMSGGAARPLRERGFISPEVPLLGKPFSKERFLALVDSVLGRGPSAG